MSIEHPHKPPSPARKPSGRQAKAQARKAAKAAQKGAHRAVKRLHPVVRRDQRQASGHQLVGSYLPDLTEAELLSRAGPPGGSQPPATYVPPGSSVGWLHGVGQAITPGPAMANTALYVREAAGRAKAKSGAAWNYCYHTHTTIPKRS